MIINHNLSAVNAQRTLKFNTWDVDKVMSKLASGMRINKAADDASGLAVSEKMRTQVAGLRQATRNTEDGLSFVQTTDGFLDQLANIMQRIRVLAVQASNGIYTADGGSHENGAKAGLVKAVRNYLSIHNLQPKGTKITADDIREGLLCLVAVKLPADSFQAQFQGQTKSRLNNPEVAPIVEATARTLEQLLNEKPTAAQSIINRVVLAAKARTASRAAGQGDWRPSLSSLR